MNTSCVYHLPMPFKRRPLVCLMLSTLAVVACRSGDDLDAAPNQVRPADNFGVGASDRPRENTRLIEAIRSKQPGEETRANDTREPIITGPLENIADDPDDVNREERRREEDGLPDPPSEAGDPAAFDDEDPQADLPPASGPPQTIGGMLGQVNGRAIYADQVLRPLEPMLRAHAESDPPGEFRKVVRASVRLRLRELVENALLLGEAERDLTASERLGLAELTRREREELIRRYGSNSLAVAEAEILRREGRTLDDAVRQWREGKTVGTYVGRKIRPRINVTRADIERYYREHPGEFNPPPTRVVRLIVATSPEDRDAAATALAEGQGFEEVASSTLNSYNRDAAGLWNAGEPSVVTFNPPVDAAIAEVDAGEWAGPVEDEEGRWWFVRVEQLERGESVSLRDAHVAIERKLSADQFRAMEGRFRARLLQEGSFTSLEAMERGAIEVALARFAPGAEGEAGGEDEDGDDEES